MNFDFNKFRDENLEVKSVFPLIVILIFLAVITILLKDSVQFMFIFALASLFFVLPNYVRIQKP